MNQETRGGDLMLERGSEKVKGEQCDDDEAKPRLMLFPQSFRSHMVNSKPLRLSTL